MSGNRPVLFGKAFLVVPFLVVPFLVVLGLFPMSIIEMGMNPLDLNRSGLAQLGLTLSAHAQSRMPIVTSDTPEYCGVLKDRISGLTRTAAMPPSTQVMELSEQGERMCGHGQIRAGVMRLRQALAIMLHGEE